MENKMRILLGGLVCFLLIVGMFIVGIFVTAYIQGEPVYKLAEGFEIKKSDLDNLEEKAVKTELGTFMLCSTEDIDKCLLVGKIE